MYKISVGLLNFVTTGTMKDTLKILCLSRWSTPNLCISSSILETVQDWLSHLWLTDVTVHWWEPIIYITEVLLKVLQVLVKQKLSKIWPKLWLFLVLCSTVQMVLTSSLWENSSKVLLVQVLGVVSINLTESILKCCLSLLSRCWLFRLPSDSIKKYSTLMVKISV